MSRRLYHRFFLSLPPPAPLPPWPPPCCCSWPLATAWARCFSMAVTRLFTISVPCSSPGARASGARVDACGRKVRRVQVDAAAQLHGQLGQWLSGLAAYETSKTLLRAARIVIQHNLPKHLISSSPLFVSLEAPSSSTHSCSRMD